MQAIEEGNTASRICDSLISDLLVLTQRTRANLKASASVVAAACGADANEHLIVLDDVTPRYVIAEAALNACHAKLEQALQLIREAGAPRETGSPARAPAALANQH
jgi:hypothetical protein